MKYHKVLSILKYICAGTGPDLDVNVLVWVGGWGGGYSNRARGQGGPPSPPMGPGHSPSEGDQGPFSVFEMLLNRSPFLHFVNFSLSF